jgi:hypothetical protein
MYQSGSKRLGLIKMCDECRVAAVTEEGFDPHAAPPRLRVRMSEYYLREGEGRQRAEKGEDLAVANGAIVDLILKVRDEGAPRRMQAEALPPRRSKLDAEPVIGPR